MFFNLLVGLALVQRFVSFHFTQGHRVKAFIAEPSRDEKKNQKVFACSHETFATLKKIFVFACLRGTASLNSCKSYTVPSHRTRWQSGLRWIKATQLQKSSVSQCLVCRVYTICVIIDYSCVFSESTKWFAVTCKAPYQQLCAVALSPSCRWLCSNRYTAATGKN